MQIPGEVDPDIGYISLSRFTERTESELARALVALLDDGATGIVVDLRGNPGGLLKSAVDVVDKFLHPICWSCQQKAGRRIKIAVTKPGKSLCCPRIYHW